MRIDDIEDRLHRAGADRGEQPLADRHAAAGINDGHALVADDEADIGDIAQVLFAHEGDFAGMDEHARRDFLDGQGSDRLAAKGALRRDCKNGDEQGADEPAHGYQSEVLRALLIVFAVCGGLWGNLRRL